MRLIVVFILSSLILFASSEEYLKVKLLEKILIEVSINHEIKVWSDNHNLLDEFRNNTNFKTSTDCMHANIIILENKDKLIKGCSNKHIFVLKYSLLNALPQSFGALFWKKGRPNIVIIKSRINAQSINISKKLEPYLEEKVW